MELLEAQQILNQHGFPCGTPDGIYGSRTRVALQHFQLATIAPLYTAGGWEQDTEHALRWLPQLAPHFTTTELRSRGNGNCYIKSELLHALESLRENLARSIPIASGYRDPGYNGQLPGAATNSLHMYGLAVDIPNNTVKATLNDVRNLKLFSGIGWVRTTGYVRHVDMRHLTGRHTATPTNPTIWSYTS